MNRKWFPQGGGPSLLGLEVSEGLALTSQTFRLHLEGPTSASIPFPSSLAGGSRSRRTSGISFSPPLTTGLDGHVRATCHSQVVQGLRPPPWVTQPLSWLERHAQVHDGEHGQRARPLSVVNVPSALEDVYEACKCLCRAPHGPGAMKRLLFFMKALSESLF